MSERFRRGDSGVTIVEAAFAIPILFMFIMGLADLGMWAFNANQATNAAKDGARAAIIDYQQADVPDSEAWDAVVERVEKHLPGRSISADEIEIECVRADGGEGCAGAHPDRDRIRVKVDWTWNLVTPIAGMIGVDEGEAAGVATMAIVGKPGATPPPNPPSTPAPTSSTTTTSTSTVPPGPCAVTNITVSDDPADYQGNTRSLEPIKIQFTAQGTGCSGLAVQLSPPVSEQVQSATCESCPSSPNASTNHVWQYKSSDKVWDDGCAEVRVFWAPGATGEEKAYFRVGSGVCEPGPSA